MRTDSNTALSPLINTPTKKSSLVTPSAENAGIFANDLKKSLEVLSDKSNASKATTSSLPLAGHAPLSVHSSSDTSLPDTALSDTVLSDTALSDTALSDTALSDTSLSIKDKGNQVSLSADISEEAEAETRLDKNIVAVPEMSGKTLHINGDLLPITSATGSQSVAVENMVDGDSVEAIQTRSSNERAPNAGLNSPETAVLLSPSTENTPDNLPLANAATIKKEASSTAEKVGLNSPATAVLLSQNAENTSESLPLANAAIIKKEAGSSVDKVGLRDSSPAVAFVQGVESVNQGLDIESGLSKVDGIISVDSDEGVVLINPKTMSQVGVEHERTHLEDVSKESLEELNWVLAQMSMSQARVAPPSEATVAKTQFLPGSAVSIGDNPRMQTPSLSLLNDSLAQNDGLAGSVTEVTLEDGMVIDQPIELRKKEQEAMLARMMPTLNVDGSQESRLSDMNTMLQNGNRLSPAVLAANSVPQASAPNLAMSVPPGHPGWAGEMTQKVAWVARDGGHTAHIRLDPPELGSLTVKVSVDSDSNTQISFVAATPQARDMLESQMGRLREMLAQQGMDLSRADVDVSQQDASGAEQRDPSQGGRLIAQGDEGDEGEDTDLFSNKTSYVTSSSVDYYA